MAVDLGIFKAYDVRGLYGEQIDGDVAEQVGRAFARVLSDLSGKPVDQLRIGLGRDMRLTAPELSSRYRDGILLTLSLGAPLSGVNKKMGRRRAGVIA